MDTPQLKSFKILLVGEYCVDRYLFGTVDRISQEAPVPIFKREDWTEKDGMGGNVKNNLESLGNEVTFFHNEEPIRKTRVIDSRFNQQLLRIDIEDTPVDPIKYSSLPALTGYDAILVSDYDKGFLPLNVLFKLSNDAYIRNVPMFLDTKKSYLNGIQNCFIKLNEAEYKALTHPPEKNNHCIITKGSQGAMYRGKMYSSLEVPLADPTGAGDTFIAAFTSSYLSCGDIGESIEFANLCSAISVCKLGCYAITKADIEAHFDHYDYVG